MRATDGEGAASAYSSLLGIGAAREQVNLLPWIGESSFVDVSEETQVGCSLATCGNKRTTLSGLLLLGTHTYEPVIGADVQTNSRWGVSETKICSYSLDILNE